MTSLEEPNHTADDIHDALMELVESITVPLPFEKFAKCFPSSVRSTHKEELREMHKRFVEERSDHLSGVRDQLYDYALDTTPTDKELLKKVQQTEKRGSKRSREETEPSVEITGLNIAEAIEKLESANQDLMNRLQLKKATCVDIGEKLTNAVKKIESRRKKTKLISFAPVVSAGLDGLAVVQTPS